MYIIMKKSIQFLLKLNPKYLNRIKEEDLSEEIVLFALEKGFDYKDDKLDRYSKYENYINYNLNKNLSFVSFYIRSRHFNIGKIDEKVIQFIKKDNALFIDCIKRDINFIKYLDEHINFNDSELDEIFKILDSNNINYSELKETFVNGNNIIGLKYLNQDFSNITYFIKYNSNYLDLQNEILQMFNNNIEENITYLNELHDFQIGKQLQEKIINILKENYFLLDERTPKFIYENNDVIINLIINDLNNSKFIDREVKLYDDKKNLIIRKIKDEKYIFDKIPFCFKSDIEIKKEIINNNPYIIDNEEFEMFNGIYRMTLDLILNGKYKINRNTNLDFIETMGIMYLDEILNYDFNYIKYFENLEFRFDRNQKRLYEVLKRNNYRIIEKIPQCFQNNEYLIKEGLETQTLDINSLDLKNANYKENFKLYLINYAISNNIENEIINNWKNNIIDKSGVTFIENCLYIKEFQNTINLNLPHDIKEIFISNRDINYINLIIDKIKESNNGIEKIVVDLGIENFSIEELKKIKDKDMVVFSSRSNITRLSVDKLIEMEHLLDLMVKDIKESNLSPYEKYIAVYSIVKKFKEYKFYKDNKSEDEKYADQSRSIYLLLENDYIVCVGYAKLLTALLKRVGINSVTWGVETIDEPHSRVYVNLEDEKYNINGYYMCDPTWDYEKYDVYSPDKYNYLNLTRDNSRESSEIGKDENGKPLLYDEMFNDCTDEELLEYLIKKRMYFEDKLSELDPVFFEKIKNKEININLASIVNRYFKSKVNNDIDIRTTAKALFELNEYIYGKSKSEEERNNRWNDFIISMHYPLDLLKEDHNEKTKELYEKLKNMKVIDYINIIEDKKTGAYYKMCLEDAYELLKREYLPKKFHIKYSANNIVFMIDIDDDLYNSGKTDEVLKELLHKNYTVTNTDDFFYINLDISYKEKNFLEFYDKVKLIKEEYFEIYNNVLSNNLKL